MPFCKKNWPTAIKTNDLYYIRVFFLFRMKQCKRLLLTLICILAGQLTFAISFTSLWGGGGLSLSNNYDYGMSYGFSYAKSVRQGSGVGIGLTAFTQNFSLYYDSRGNTVSGNTISLKAQYNFFAPTITADLSRSGKFKGYVNAGVGMFGSGTTTIHKWSNVSWPPSAKWDSTNIQKSSEFSAMTYRVGIGLIHYYRLGCHFALFMNEDLGFLPLAFQNINDGNYDYTSFNGNLARFFAPAYVSLRIGVTYIHSKSQ